mgnify:CR=1 FL=1
MLNDLLTLTKIREGDIKAFEDVFRRYYSPLCWYAMSITGSMEAAEEIVEELFYGFWRDRERLPLFRSMKSYLYVAVRNQSFSILRASGGEKQISGVCSLAEGADTG